MKCENVIQNIELYFDKGLKELDPDTKQHLASCPDCNIYFKMHKKAEELVTSICDFEPVLTNPSSLTDDIMMALDTSASSHEADKNIRPVTIFKNIIFRWSLSAAAIIIFALFCFEQYLVLDKINRLETQFQNTSGSKIAGKNMRMYNSWETRTLRSFNHVKTNNKELLKIINSFKNNISLSQRNLKQKRHENKIFDLYTSANRFYP